MFDLQHTLPITRQEVQKSMSAALQFMNSIFLADNRFGIRCILHVETVFNHTKDVLGEVHTSIDEPWLDQLDAHVILTCLTHYLRTGELSHFELDLVHTKSCALTAGTWF